MATINNFKNKKIQTCRVITLAPSFPKYSEVWMERMNDMLQPEHLFVALSSSEILEDEKNNSFSLSPYTNLPNKVHMTLFGGAIRRQLTKLLEAIPEDAVVLCHYLTTAVYMWDVLKKCKQTVFVHCHGHDVTWNRKVEKFPFLPAHGSGYKKRVQKLKGKVFFISNSNCTKKKLVDIGFPCDDVFVNYLSVDTTLLKPVKKEISEEISILYLGRLTDFKGPVETILAFENACTKGLNAKLDIVGAGSLMNRCIKLRNKSKFKDKILIHGSADRNTALNFLGNADIFTAHNKRSTRTGQEEAFGVSIIEAMAYGLPVITGASGGVTETVLDGVTGFLIPPGDIEEHSNAFLKVSNNTALRESMGKKGRARVEELFDSKNDELELKKILGV
jgi:glycosyltransferase involved in cell wall biosynthesis